MRNANVEVQQIHDTVEREPNRFFRVNLDHDNLLGSLWRKTLWKWVSRSRNGHSFNFVDNSC